MTRLAPVGDAVTCSTPATPRKATAPIFILCSSPWRVRREFRRDLKSDFPCRADKHSAEIAGYHCWADFFEPQHGWIPVDISEAWKHPEKKDYFFGAHDANRVEFTMGRDLELSPKQDGKPLNYFVYPYVEVAGKEYPNVSTAFSFCRRGRRSRARAGDVHVGADALVRSAQQLVTVIGSLALAARTRRPGLRGRR